MAEIQYAFWSAVVYDNPFDGGGIAGHTDGNVELVVDIVVVVEGIKIVMVVADVIVVVPCGVVADDVLVLPVVVVLMGDVKLELPVVDVVEELLVDTTEAVVDRVVDEVDELVGSIVDSVEVDGLVVVDVVDGEASEVEFESIIPVTLTVEVRLDEGVMVVVELESLTIGIRTGSVEVSVVGVAFNVVRVVMVVTKVELIALSWDWEDPSGVVGIIGGIVVITSVLGEEVVVDEVVDGIVVVFDDEDVNVVGSVEIMVETAKRGVVDINDCVDKVGWVVVDDWVLSRIVQSDTLTEDEGRAVHALNASTKFVRLDSEQSRV
jgi:hypothetical protein